MLFFGSGSAHATNFWNFFTIAPVLKTAPKIVAIHRLYIYHTLQVLQKKTWSIWFGLELPSHQSQSKLAHKCIPYNNRCLQNFIQIG